jgi:TolA-binding protein
MSEPESGSAPQKPLTKMSATPPPPPQEFDLLAFWIQYRKTILGCFYALIAGVAIFAVYLFAENKKKEDSQNALAGAKTAADFSKVATEWSGTAAAATAQFRAADELRKEGKIDEAAKEYRDFATKNPTHPLMIGSIASLGLMLESAGKNEEALATYQRIQNSYATSGHFPVALMGIARIQAATGKTDEAVKTLDTLIQKTAGRQNGFGFEAQRMQAALKNPNARKTGGTPRPAPPVTAPTATPGAANPIPPMLQNPGFSAPATPAPAAVTPAPAPAVPAAPPIEAPAAKPAEAPKAPEPAKPAEAPKAPESAKPAEAPKAPEPAKPADAPKAQ